MQLNEIQKAPAIKAEELQFDKQYLLFNSVVGEMGIFEICAKPYVKETRSQTTTWVDVVIWDRGEKSNRRLHTFSAVDYNLIPNKYNDHKVVEYI